MRLQYVLLLLLIQLNLFSEHSTLLIDSVTFSFNDDINDHDALRLAENSVADYFNIQGAPAEKFYSIKLTQQSKLAPPSDSEQNITISLAKNLTADKKTFTISEQLAEIWFPDLSEMPIRRFMAYKQVYRFHGEAAYNRKIGKLYAKYRFSTTNETDLHVLHLLTINTNVDDSIITELNDIPEITERGLGLSYGDYILEYKLQGFQQNLPAGLWISGLLLVLICSLILFRPKNSQGRKADKIAALIITGSIQLFSSIICFLFLPLEAITALWTGVLASSITAIGITYFRTRTSLAKG